MQKTASWDQLDQSVRLDWKGMVRQVISPRRWLAPLACPMSELEKTTVSSWCAINGSYDFQHEIRALKVLNRPNPGKRSYMEFAMVTLSLDETPVQPYFAISYVWGQASKTRPIIIDGLVVDVPRNATRVLERLQFQVGDLVWIDAICINQQDQVEKGFQVAFMKDVYSKAVEVRIWLGNLTDPVANNALSSLQTIFDQCLEETNNLADFRRHLFGDDNSAAPAFRYSNKPLPASCNWPAVKRLYDLPWFNRLWVIQEVALARRPVCYVGQQTVDAKVIVVAAKWMVHRRYARHFGGEEIDGVESASSMYQPGGQPLGEQLRQGHRSLCRKPQDKVYGLLGLANPHIAAQIKPDYSKPVSEVYAQAIRLAILEVDHLFILHFVAWFRDVPSSSVWGKKRQALCNLCGCNEPTEDGKDGDKWPSWVPKLHGSIENARGSCLNVLSFGKTVPCEELRLRVEEVSDPCVLRIRGWPLAKVEWVAPRFSEVILDNSEKLAQLVTSCVRRSHDRPAGKGDAAGDDLPFTFTCGTNTLNQDVESHQELRENYEEFARWSMTTSSVRPSLLERLRTRRTQTHGAPSRAAGYLESVRRQSVNRHFVIADGMPAMGPPGAQVGDCVCLLSGDKVPFLLRSEGAYWKLRGDVYMRKFMKEGAVDDLFASGKLSGANGKWFEIR
ncbi:heterokaryon incompatibility protein-domain-containing protein [Xylariaceae sp. FL0016]|nr:heterokaryon incompatibility protein-domain-containing protein [Xylariaceae sp. FL0016]